MLVIGSIELPLPVVQAALSGYSDWPMRHLAREMGAPYTICEVMIDTFVNNLRDRSKTAHFLHLTDADRPAGAQLMGAVPEEFAAAAARLAASGFDVIDINFGCPVKKVLGRCRGGFHLSRPDVALEIVRRVRDVVPADIPVTVKMRRGIDDTQEAHDQFFEVLDGAFESGVAAVTVHGRTVEQRYIGPSSWEFLRQLKADRPDRTILGSGDLFTAEDCLRMLETTGVDGVTAARGSIGNPWIFRQTKALLEGKRLPDAPSVFEQRDVMLRHFALAEQIYGRDRAARQLRKFGMRYADWHPADNEVRQAFIRARNADDWFAVISSYYAADDPGAYPTVLRHKGLDEAK